jgi:FtsP/CotA-like multicopper oxidase with cupredoxin domain
MDAPNLSRRDMLKASVFGAAAIALPWESMLSAKSASRIASSKLPKPYTVPFTKPPVLKPALSVGDTDYYRIVQKEFDGEILPGVRTTMWGYNGLVPGPTIQVTKGRKAVVRQVNNLPARHAALGYVPWTSTHLHGMPSEPQFDGYASDNSQPGEWKDYHYPNTCEARTLWYHDHGLHHTAENVYMGLAAQYHLYDEVERALPLPQGDYDVPLILGDRMFAANGALMWDDNSHSGVYGDVIIVNGKPWPKMLVEQRKYRFRVLNGSISRGYTLKLSNGQPFHVVATDGGLMERPQKVTQFTIGMAERYEIVIDFANLGVGQTIQLVNLGVKNAVDYDNTGKVMQFQASGPARVTTNNEVPDVLLTTPHPAMLLQPSSSLPVRRLRLERSNGLWTINGKTWVDVEKSRFTDVLCNPKPGDVEIWEIENSSGGWFHPTHIHLVDFQVLSRNGRPPRPEEKGPKDVVYVGENETVRLIMQFSKPDGPHGRYMIHCHNLSHEDHDMMVQFQVGGHDDQCDPVNAAPPIHGAELPW